MEPMQLGNREQPANTEPYRERYMLYLLQETKRICIHLEKLDRLPLDLRFDFRIYLGRAEFVYTGGAAPTSLDDMG